MRVFLDANILFSAAKSDGAIRRLLTLLETSGVECWVDTYVVEEAKRNLIGKYASGAQDLDALIPRLNVTAIHPGPVGKSDLDKLPAKDRPVLAAAIRLRCDALVTGDKTHFGKHYGKQLGGVSIFSPAGLAEFMSTHRSRPAPAQRG